VVQTRPLSHATAWFSYLMCTLYTPRTNIYPEERPQINVDPVPVMWPPHSWTSFKLTLAARFFISVYLFFCSIQRSVKEVLPGAEFLAATGTKVLKFFLLAVHSHVY
jgi:hypothetical protein